MVNRKETNMLSEVVAKAMGNRSVRKFASDTGVAASYIIGMLKGKYPAPSAATLSKLATKAQNGVTKEELMVSAGYIPQTVDDMARAISGLTQTISELTQTIELLRNENMQLKAKLYDSMQKGA